MIARRFVVGAWVIGLLFMAGGAASVWNEHAFISKAMRAEGVVVAVIETSTQRLEVKITGSTERQYRPPCHLLTIAYRDHAGRDSWHEWSECATAPSHKAGDRVSLAYVDSAERGQRVVRVVSFGSQWGGGLIAVALGALCAGFGAALAWAARRADAWDGPVAPAVKPRLP